MKSICGCFQSSWLRTINREGFTTNTIIPAANNGKWRSHETDLPYGMFTTFRINELFGCIGNEIDDHNDVDTLNPNPNEPNNSHNKNQGKEQQ